MKYDKPQIVLVASAVETIQSCAKGIVSADCGNSDQPTNGAYEADE
jgi:hypothetical protein